jgi:hypothetical protein
MTLFSRFTRIQYGEFNGRIAQSFSKVKQGLGHVDSNRRLFRGMLTRTAWWTDRNVVNLGRKNRRIFSSWVNRSFFQRRENNGFLFVTHCFFDMLPPSFWFCTRLSKDKKRKGMYAENRGGKKQGTPFSRLSAKMTN